MVEKAPHSLHEVCTRVTALLGRDPSEYVSDITRDTLIRWTKALEGFQAKSSHLTPVAWASQLDSGTLNDIYQYITAKEQQIKNEIPFTIPKFRGLLRTSSVVICGIRTMQAGLVQRQLIKEANMNQHKYHVLKRNIELIIHPTDKKYASYEDLKTFLNRGMWMEENYQPVMIKALLLSNGKLTRTGIALHLNEHNRDKHDLDFRYVEVFRALTVNGVVRREGKQFLLNAENLTQAQRGELVNICNKKIDEFTSLRAAAKKTVGDLNNLESAKEARKRIGRAIKSKNIILLKEVLTGEGTTLRVYRIGQDVLRKYALQIYSHRCALCDVNDDKLLIASHIVPWSEDKEIRGVLENVLCLCRLHDGLFENGRLVIGADDNANYDVRFADSFLERSKDSRSLALFKGITYPTMQKPSSKTPNLHLFRRHREKFPHESYH